MSAKHLFSRSLNAVPGRLHMAAHSHHLWPDVSRDGQMACWDDAALLADRKWDRVMGEVWPQAQRHAEEAIRAVQLSAPFELPADQYDLWKSLPPLRFRKNL